jgi:hypothetical protein
MIGCGAEEDNDWTPQPHCLPPSAKNRYAREWRRFANVCCLSRPRVHNRI